MKMDQLESSIWHVTDIVGRDVYGHEMSHCDAGGCAATDKLWFGLIEHYDTLRIGGLYEISVEGRILAEIE